MKTTITNHGKLRIKERVGLPKRAHLRHVQKVLSDGLLYSREGFEKFKVLYHGFLYIFALDDSLHPILVTAYQNQTSLS